MLYQASVQRFLLIRYRTAWEKQPTRWFALDDLIQDEDFKFLYDWEIKTIDDLHPYVVDLHESDLLDRNKAFFKITKKGRDGLEPPRITEEQQIKNKERLDAKQERDEDRKDRKIQHDEMVKVARDANKWTKKGMIIAIILGGTGLALAIFYP